MTSIASLIANFETQSDGEEETNKVSRPPPVRPLSVKSPTHPAPPPPNVSEKSTPLKATVTSPKQSTSPKRVVKSPSSKSVSTAKIGDDSKQARPSGNLGPGKTRSVSVKSPTRHRSSPKSTDTKSNTNVASSTPSDATQTPTLESTSSQQNENVDEKSQTEEEKSSETFVAPSLPSEKSVAKIERSKSGKFKKFEIPQEQGESTEGNKRLMVLQETIISEQDYVKDLGIIINSFLIPLRATGNLEIPMIFGNVELIYSVNTELLAKLNATLENEDAKDGAFLVGHIFLEMSSNLLCYDQYITNHKNAAARLQRCLKQSTFSQEVEKCRNRMIANGQLLHLPDLLIKPIQRICKYPLLFKELLKCTPMDHPDYVPLVNALSKLEEIASKINDSKRDAENMQTLTNLQSKIDGMDLKLAEAGRYFVKEGVLQKVNPRGKVQSRQFFLFSDMFMWCKPKTGLAINKKHYQYKGSVMLNLAVVRDTPGDKTNQFRFQIIKLDTKKIYDLVADSEETKRQWMAAVDQLVSAWLETEKINNQERDAQRMHRNDSNSGNNFPASPGVPRRSVNVNIPSSPSVKSRGDLLHSPKHATESQLAHSPGNSKLATASEPLTSDSPLIRDLLSTNEQLREQVAQLVKSSSKTYDRLEALFEENNKLKNQVAELEQTVLKQAKVVRKLKKGPTTTKNV